VKAISAFDGANPPPPPKLASRRYEPSAKFIAPKMPCATPLASSIPVAVATTAFAAFTRLNTTWHHAGVGTTATHASPGCGAPAGHAGVRSPGDCEVDRASGERSRPQTEIDNQRRRESRGVVGVGGRGSRVCEMGARVG